MSGYTFRPAIREGLGIFIGLAGESGSGKTWSAMVLASGIVGEGKRFAVIDTENKRARHYADDFAFDVLDLDAPYTSERYEGAVKAAYSAGYKAIVVDSVTHEHEGEGGYLDASNDALDVMVKRYLERYPNSKEWEVREKLTPGAYKEPSRLRKRMMYTLLACSSTTPIIFCFRAEEQVWGTKDGKLVAYNPPRWRAICGKKMPFEMTVSLMMHADRPGYPIAIKLPDKFKGLFPADKPITEESGRRLAEWSRGASGSADTHTITQPASPQRAREAAESGSSATEPDDPRERAKLVASIRALAPKVTAADRETAKRTYHVGDPQSADLSALREYESWLKTRAGEA